MSSKFDTEAFTLLALAIVIIALRTIARWKTAGPKNFQVDDYLMLAAGITYGIETGAAYIVGAWFHGLANNAMTDEERRLLHPDSEEYRLRVGGSKTQVIGWSLYTLLLWLLKTCMAVFYSRLTSGLINLQLRVRIAYVLIGVTYVATILSILFGCHPMHKNWQIYPDPGNYCQPAVSKIDVYVTVFLNVATDMYLISIPTPMLFKARLPIREKIELLILFSGGIFVMMAAILRAVLILTAGPNGAEQAGSWACRETFVAIVINNTPMIYPVIRRTILRRSDWSITSITRSISNHILGSRSRNRSRSRSHSSSSQGQPIPGFQIFQPGQLNKTSSSNGKNTSNHSRNQSQEGQKKKKRFRHPLSIPTNMNITTVSQSQTQTQIQTQTQNQSQSQWNTLTNPTLDEQMILPTFRQQSPICTGGGGFEGNGAGGGDVGHDGIRVICETIIESEEKIRGSR